MISWSKTTSNYQLRFCWFKVVLYISHSKRKKMHIFDWFWLNSKCSVTFDIWYFQLVIPVFNGINRWKIFLIATLLRSKKIIQYTWHNFWTMGPNLTLIMYSHLVFELRSIWDQQYLQTLTICGRTFCNFPSDNYTIRKKKEWWGFQKWLIWDWKRV